jgi:hypothetical protein
LTFYGMHDGWGAPIALASLWSMGWMIADFVDRRTAEGESEWTQWRTDLADWHQAATHRQSEAERRWAAPFPTYQAYRDARHGREGDPLTSEEFIAAKRREPPR